VSTSKKRDADMDRLLRAVLKPAPSQPGATGSESGPCCPDAAVLAAFVEGGLTATEQSALDAHIAACGRCQEALAILSHDLPEAEEEYVAAPESGWFTWVTRPRLRWLVPISAAATVAAVFFATRPLIAPEGEVPGTEVARMAQGPVPPAELPGAGAGASREQSAAVPQKGQPAGLPERRETGRALADVPPPTLAGQAAPDKKAPAEAAAAEVPERLGAAEPRPRVVAEPVATQAAAAPASVYAPAKGAAATKMPAADAMRAMPTTPLTREELRRLEPGPTVTAEPDGRVRWRLGPGGRIWRSTDAGSTWHWQPTDVSANLVAGSAPSATTCWAVGTGGVVLLTVDGQRWTLLPFPLRVDLAAVHATNARIATITTRDGRRFETTDAGLTWSPK
jgi:hypothetical protein